MKNIIVSGILTAFFVFLFILDIVANNALWLIIFTGIVAAMWAFNFGMFIYEYVCDKMIEKALKERGL